METGSSSEAEFDENKSGAESSEAQAERKWQWANPQIEGLKPRPRGGHSATLAGASLIIFGGHYYAGGDKGFAYLNDVVVLDVNGNRWTRPTISGLPPAPRYGHSSILAGSNVIIFGGRGEKGAHFRDLHALDSLKMAWLNGPEGGAAPSGRLDHSATLVGNKMFVFGGWNGTEYYNDLYVLDLESMAWSRPSTSGYIPCPRMGHCAVLAGNTLIIQGGFYFDEERHKNAGMRMGTMLSQCYLNDIRMLDTETFVWDRLNVSGVPPPPCFGHSMEVSGNDIIVFGGWGGFASKKQPPEALENSCEYFVILSTDSMTWERGKYIGLPPPPRYGHSATAIGPHVLIFGGWESNQAVNDIIVLRDLSAVGKANK